MRGPSPDALLRRAPDLEIRVDSAGNFRIKHSERGTVECGPHAWSVLAVFSRPRRLSEALTELRGRLTGRQDWIDLMSTVVGLYEAGVLRDQDDAGRAPPALATSGFSRAGIHIAMLGDRARTSSFLAAIAEIVRPGDVVVDVGTGTGVLAVAAARAGARHVYAIEASAIDDVAERVFEANGVADRVTLVRGWSSRVTLPERADVLVSEILGNDPLSESVLETILDAKKRLLVPGARLVPNRVRVLGLPVTLPRKELEATSVAPHLDDWRAWYGIDLSPLAASSDGRMSESYVDPYEARGWPTLADPIVLIDVDLTTVTSPSIANRIGFHANADGDLNGILVYFEIDLGPTTSLSLHPARVASDNHWRCPLYAIPSALPVKAGELLEVTYGYGRSAAGISALRVVSR
jgi:hypothetical protein